MLVELIETVAAGASPAAARKWWTGEEQPDALEKIREGKVQAAGAIIGAVMKAMGRSTDAGRMRELVLERAQGPS